MRSPAPPSTPVRLPDTTALVTGAGSGIGAAIARRFAREGAFVYVTDRDAASAAATAAAIAAEGGQAVAAALDVTDEAACAAAVAAVEREYGRLDVLVNNAGIGHVGTVLQTTGEDLDRLYAVNVRGVFTLSKAALPGMVARKSGTIVNLASIGGVVGIRDRAAYCATKFAVVGLTQCMALDHAADGVRVNCICPGRVETPFVQARLAEYPDPEAARREMTATQALRRMASPDEIAAAALYLASDEAAFVTGTPFLIDGGWTAGK
jgi:NAD(P)-dependent dehydrogenase (short-subunit alcohol dehydrogenase family)